MQLTLGFSPCPNDTFIFDALVHHKIDTEGLSFQTVLEDVETLNQKAFRNELNITKLSYHAFAYASVHYVLLHSGSALGNACGPLLIGKKKLSESEVEKALVAIPGKYTTANLLFLLAYPKQQHKKEYVFSEIEDAILTEKVDAGVIIHENRFTYQLRNLVKTVDLGDFWEQKTKLPIPLGGIAVQRSLPLEIQQKINRVMRRSVEYALAYPQSSREYVCRYAQEMQREVMEQHIQLYVNHFTVELGEIGAKAIEILYETAQKYRIIPTIQKKIFVADFGGFERI
jgi:1,4-dihydroxy-6-naphthoate synthase